MTDPNEKRSRRRFNDVTAQVLAQEALRDSQRSLQQANEAIERANQELERRVQQRTAELLETQQALLRKERLAAIGTFAASIVHEIRSPLSTIALALHHVGRLELAPGSDKRVRLASEETTRLERLLSEILLYARPQESKLESVDLGAVVASSVAEVRQMPASRDRRIAFEPRDLPTIDGSRDKLHQVFLNLLVNACEASPEGGTVTVRLERPEGVNQLRVSVHNGGPPIPQDLAETVTQAFCTTKPAGTGLGLSIVQRIVDAHRGRLAFESSQESGTTFTVELPLTP